LLLLLLLLLLLSRVQPIGRSVDETLRLVQAIQFHAKYGEVRVELVLSRMNT
jgi:alkyl hydroperoxide reductase subunit AhpC